MHHNVKHHWPIIILLILSLILCVTNYTPHTFLSGWDTLHPEFDFSLNLQRLFFGVFREEQGLGAVAAHAHMADIPRVLLLAVFHLALPVSFLRYSFIFLTLIVGPIGMYYFLKKVVFATKNSAQQTQSIALTQLNETLHSDVPAFLGGVFYLLNLGTMQQFSVPFEMFNTLYAALPWLMLCVLQYLCGERRQRRSALLAFSIISLLAAPMAYASVLWYVYVLLLGIFLGSFLFAQRTSLLRKSYLHRSIVLLGLTILINSFWFLPNLYFLFTHSASVQDAYTNKLFSPQAFLYNKEFGTLPNLLLLKSFLFDWRVYTSGGFDNLLQPWIVYLQNLPILLIGFGAATIACLGLLMGTLKRHRIVLLSLPSLLFVLFFLVNENGPTGPLFAVLRDHFPLFKEALRFPHSKFYVHYIFFFSLFFALGNAEIITLLERISSSKRIVKSLTHLVYPSLITLFLGIFMFPAFQGNMINPAMRITIPQEYFQMAHWFRAQDASSRIAPLPINSFWGWEYYDWNRQANTPSYQGAGFQWFLLPQAYLARDFDRWNPANEEYYREMAQAVYTQNKPQIAAVLKKYAVSYILLDTSISAATDAKQTLFYPQLKSLLSDTKFFTKKAQFGSHLFVYTPVEKVPSVIHLLSHPTTVMPATVTGFSDPAYLQVGEYTAADPANPALFYPGRALIANDSRLTKDLYTLSADAITLPLQNPLLDIPTAISTYLTTETTLPAKLKIIRNGQHLTLSILPQTPLSQTVAASTLTAQMTLPASASNPALSLNNDHVIAVTETMPDQHIVLNTKMDTPLTIYQLPSGSKPVIDFSTLHMTVAPCKDALEKNVYGFSLSPSHTGMSLIGKNTSICLMLPLAELVTNPPADSFLFTLSLKTSGSNQSRLSLCLARTATEECLTPASEVTNSSFVLHKAAIASQSLLFVLDTGKSPGTLTETLSDLSFQTAVPLSTFSITPQVLAQALAKTPSTPVTQLKIPLLSDPAQPTEATKLSKTDGSCSDNPLVQVRPNPNQAIETHTGFLRYKAENGSICDHFSYKNHSGTSAYLLLVESRNLEGNPLTLCVTNSETRRCDVYASLTPSKTFTTDVFLIPPSTSATHGYDLNLENLGVSGSPAYNDLRTVRLVPFPVTWLTSIHIGTVPSQKASQIPLTAKIYNDEFTFTLPPQKEPTTLVLNQAYENGWQAYTTDSWLSRTFPMLFGKPVRTHVLVNNWANGWKIAANGEAHAFRLLYLPQSLESLGWVLCFLTIFTITFRWWRKQGRD